MSISAQGRSRLNWVCRWRSGFWSAWSPPIHIRAGENVCIQAITPTHSSEALAARQAAAMLSDDLTIGLKTTRTGIESDLSRALAITPAFAATWPRTSSPYRSWLPVRNQTSYSPSGFIP